MHLQQEEIQEDDLDNHSQSHAGYVCVNLLDPGGIISLVLGLRMASGRNNIKRAVLEAFQRAIIQEAEIKCSGFILIGALIRELEPLCS